MKVDLNGKVAVVTGASSGIGADTALKMAAVGAHVVGVGRNRERLEAVGAQVREAGGAMTPVIAELADTSTHAEIVDVAAGVNGSVDAVVHAAGHFVSSPFAETSEAELEDQWAVHVRAPFFLTQALLPHMSKGSSILFFSSTVASVGFAPYAAYTACKGAVEAMSRSLAIELAPDIRVNTMVPGFTATPMVTDQYVDAPGMEEAIETKTPVGFVGGPESAAGLATLLASDLASYVDGARLVVDGGWSAQGWQP